MSPGLTCLPCHRYSVGCALIIRLIVQTILLYLSGAVWTDGPSNVSRLDPSGADQVDAEHPARNRKVARRLSGKDARRELRGQIIPCLQGQGGAVRPSAAPAPAGAPAGWGGQGWTAPR